VNLTPPDHPRHPRRHAAAAESAAWLFYIIAAIGSTAGQVWVGITTPPWPPAIAWWVRGLLVLPFAAVIDLGGVVTSAFADWRQRLGETAYGWRALSACTVSIAVAINLIGHHDNPYLAVVFAGLGVFAYSIWLGHAGARRRDALRAAGKLADTAPDYGIAQKLREPAVTRCAETLAVQHGHDLHTSLTLARQQLREETRNAAVAKHVATLIRAQHKDPVLADIAATTLDIDAVAAELTAQADVTGWARTIGANLTPPPPPAGQPAPAAPIPDAPGTDVVLAPPVDVLKRIPTRQDDYDRWRQLWAALLASPELTSSEFARRHGISIRQAQWIRSVGATGLLDSPVPPAVRLAHMARRNGHTPYAETPAT
jgi:hypothetical protein